MDTEMINPDQTLSIGTQSSASIQMTSHGKGAMIGVANNPSITVNNYGLSQEMFNVFMNEFMETFMSQQQATSSLKSQTQRLLESPQETSHAIEWAALRTDCFNLFVLENERYNCGAFAISKARALRKYVCEEYISLYRILDPTAINSIIEMPCIFTMRNKFFRRSGNTQPAALGRLTSITRQLDNIRFTFDIFQPPVPQQIINDNIPVFNLAHSTLRNELDEEHWSIKPGNLQEIIARLGIDVR